MNVLDNKLLFLIKKFNNYLFIKISIQQLRLLNIINGW